MVEQKVTRRYVSQVSKKSMIVSNNTSLQADKLNVWVTFWQGRKSGNNVGLKYFKNPGKSSDVAADIGKAAPMRNFTALAATAPEVSRFNYKNKGVY